MVRPAVIRLLASTAAPHPVRLAARRAFRNVAHSAHRPAAGRVTIIASQEVVRSGHPSVVRPIVRTRLVVLTKDPARTVGLLLQSRHGKVATGRSNSPHVPLAGSLALTARPAPGNRKAVPSNADRRGGPPVRLRSVAIAPTRCAQIARAVRRQAAGEAVRTVPRARTTVRIIAQPVAQLPVQTSGPSPVPISAPINVRTSVPTNAPSAVQSSDRTGPLQDPAPAPLGRATAALREHVRAAFAPPGDVALVPGLPANLLEANVPAPGPEASPAAPVNVVPANAAPEGNISGKAKSARSWRPSLHLLDMQLFSCISSQPALSFNRGPSPETRRLD